VRAQKKIKKRSPTQKARRLVKKISGVVL